MVSLLMPRFQWSPHLLKILMKSSVESLWHTPSHPFLTVLPMMGMPAMFFLALGNKTKSAGAKLGLYGGWLISLIDLAAMNSFVIFAMWELQLSMCNNHPASAMSLMVTCLSASMNSLTALMMSSILLVFLGLRCHLSEAPFPALTSPMIW